MRRDHPFLSALAAALAGFMLSGCSAFSSPETPVIRLYAAVDRQVAEAPVVRVSIGGRRVDVTPHIKGGRPTFDIETRGPRFGNVGVRVALLSIDGDSLATVEFTQLFERGQIHWINTLVGLNRPVGDCIGYMAVKPLPVDAFAESGAVPDTLFVTYGGLPKGYFC